MEPPGHEGAPASRRRERRAARAASGEARAQGALAELVDDAALAAALAPRTIGRPRRVGVSIGADEAGPWLLERRRPPEPEAAPWLRAWGALDEPPPGAAWILAVTPDRGAAIVDLGAVHAARRYRSLPDAGPASASDTVRVLTTDQAPTARVIAPAAGTVRLGDALSLDRPRSGRRGKGERVTVPVSRLFERLGLGRVELRLVTTDRDGASSQTAAVALTLEDRAPGARSDDPTAGTTFTTGGVLLCSGCGQDPDRSRLLENDELVWTARRARTAPRASSAGARASRSPT